MPESSIIVTSELAPSDSAVAATLQEGPHAAALGVVLGFAWVITAVIFMRRAPVLSDRFILEPFSLIRPAKWWGWIIFVIAIKGVLTFYAALFMLGAPVFLLAYARRVGVLHAWFALCCALALHCTGVLGTEGWVAVLWLQGVLLVLAPLGRVLGRVLARPALQAA